MARPTDEVEMIANATLAKRVVELTQLATMILTSNDVPEGPIRAKARELLRTKHEVERG